MESLSDCECQFSLVKFDFFHELDCIAYVYLATGFELTVFGGYPDYGGPSPATIAFLSYDLTILFSLSV